MAYETFSTLLPRMIEKHSSDRISMYAVYWEMKILLHLIFYETTI